MTRDDTSNSSPLHTLGWAFYLAVSWTWCIGMFLPALLVRDYGVWGFVVFAVPNVLGAAAMGWVLRSRGTAERILMTHGAAVRAFSIVTIAFHVFWLVWLMTWVRGVVVLPRAMLLGVIGVCIAFVFVGSGMIRDGRGRTVAVVVWVFGAGLLAVLAAMPGAVEPAAGLYLRQAPPGGLVWLAPICAFGFALCPYLDATFLHARASCGDGQARAAFTIGFGVLFSAMIVLTLAYSGLFAGVFDNDMATVPGIAVGVGAWLLVHMLVQAITTVELHHERLGQLESEPGGESGLGISVSSIFLFAAVIAAGLLGLFHRHIPAVGTLTGGEVVYRVFMSFYGLVFPAYVWLCVIPTRDGHAGIIGRSGRRKLAVLIGAIVIATPFFWMGFIVRDEVWLAPGLVVVLMARVVLPR